MIVASGRECCTFGAPTYVTLAYVAGFACAPLVLCVPPPARVAAHAALVCRVLLALTAGLLALLVVVMAVAPGWPGVTLGGLALISLMLMFWAASEPRRRRRGDGDDDEPGGGGGGPRRPPHPWDLDGPGGLAIDWAEFDRQRAAWRDAPPVASGP